MYRFPLWKHLLVLVVLVVAVLFALPNAFGEDPALQLSRDDRAAMDEASQQRVLGILSAAAIPVAASHIEEDRLVVRFPLVDQQLKARDAILDAAGSEYLVALTNAPRTPAWLRNLAAPVTLSSSHAGWCGLNRESLFMQTGEAAGVAAAICIRYNCEVDEIPVRELQALLRRNGAILSSDEARPWEPSGGAK